MPILYGIPVSPPFRAVLLTAKAVGVDIEEKPLNMMNNEHKSPAFLKMNPTHTIPTLDDNGFYIWESRAIMGYLVNKYGKDDSLYPKDPVKRALVDNMLYFDATCLFASASIYIHSIMDKNKKHTPEELAAQKATVIERLGFFEAILGRHPYAAGDRLTIADLSLIGTINSVEMSHISLDDFPNVKKWTAKIKLEVPYVVEITEKADAMLKVMLAAMEKK